MQESSGRGEGIRLKLLRIRMGVRQTQLAHVVGIGVAQLSAWEDGRQPIPPRQQQHLVDALDRLTLRIDGPGGKCGG